MNVKLASLVLVKLNSFINETIILYIFLFLFSNPGLSGASCGDGLRQTGHCAESCFSCGLFCWSLECVKHVPSGDTHPPANTCHSNACAGKAFQLS